MLHTDVRIRRSAWMRERPADPKRRPLLLLRLNSFLLARARQDGRKRVVALVACVFVNHLVDAVERQLAAVRRGHRRWIIHREFVERSLPAEVGALFMKSLQAAMNEVPKGDDVSAEVSTVKLAKPAIAQHRADALALMAESFATHGAGALPGADRQLITVHVSAETLRERCAGECEIEDGASIPAETARTSRL